MAGPSPIRAHSPPRRFGDSTSGSPRSWPLELSLYRLVTRLARPLAGTILGVRAHRGKEDPDRRGERLGIASVARPPGPVVWVHAASVGEASAVLPLLAAMITRRPDLALLLTTGTVTSTKFVASRLPVGVVHQLVPLDCPSFVARFLEHWRPSLAVLTEQEVWPNLVLEAHARGVPLALVNARMSERSFSRWQSCHRVANALFSRFSVVLAQNDTLAGRFVQLGATRAIVAGNLKVDAPPPRIDAEAVEALNTALGQRPRLVAASTHEGEERIIGAAHRQLARKLDGFCTIIAPRHPDRGPSIGDALAADGFRIARRSLGELPGPSTDIYIADTIGELGTLYASAPVAFIGGTLVPRGGQNPIEAVRLGAVVLAGPSRFNFEDAYGALAEARGATEVLTADDIAHATAALIADSQALGTMRERATRALSHLSGALDRTVMMLLPLLPDQVEDERGAV